MKKLIFALLLFACGAASGRGSGPVFTPADSPEIRFTGRAAKGPGGALSFDWSGSHFTFRFEGTRCAMRAADTGRNYYNVFVDGRHTGVAKGPTAEVVETIDLDLAADDRFYAWNVLGAAPVRIATVEFLSESLASAGGDTKAPVLEDFAGVPFVAAARVDYPFQELPNSVKSIGSVSVSDTS